MLLPLIPLASGRVLLFQNMSAEAMSAEDMIDGECPLEYDGPKITDWAAYLEQIDPSLDLEYDCDLDDLNLDLDAGEPLETVSLPAEENGIIPVVAREPLEAVSLPAAEASNIPVTIMEPAALGPLLDEGQRLASRVLPPAPPGFGGQTEKVPVGNSPGMVVIMSAATRQRIAEAIGKQRCLVCDRNIAKRRNLRSHVSRHFTGVFCACGYGKNRRDEINTHRQECDKFELYQVDEDSLEEFIERVQPECIPRQVPLLGATSDAHQVPPLARPREIEQSPLPDLRVRVDGERRGETEERRKPPPAAATAPLPDSDGTLQNFRVRVDDGRREVLPPRSERRRTELIQDIRVQLDRGRQPTPPQPVVVRRREEFPSLGELRRRRADRLERRGRRDREVRELRRGQ